MINSDFGSDSVNHKVGDEDNSSGQCFYKLCDKQKLFGFIPCGRFRDRKHALYCYLFSAMVTCLFIAVIAPMVLYTLANDEINAEVVIDSTSAPNYNAWQNNVYGDGAEHIKIQYNLYYFEVQNMAEALSGARPKLMQVGPYAYDEYYVKFDITWTDGGDTVTYGTQRYYLFNPEATGPGLSQDDQITLPYTTVSGFVYLLGTIDEDQQQAIDNELHYQIETKQVELITAINEIYFVISHDTDIPLAQRVLLRNLIHSTNQSINTLFNDVYDYMDRSNFGDMLLKTLMCKAGNLSPFWKVDPFRAWFGWLHDPLLTEMQVLLDAVANKTGEAIPWTAAVPGAATNWTSIEETRRRKNPDTNKTGKKNPNQVGQYVRYNNMTELWTCVAPMDSQNVSLYDPETQFPACAHFQYEWTDEEAYAMGYRKPFATNFANRIWGTDANSFGRPITTDKLAVFISDIYRSCFLAYVEDEDWNGVTTWRFGIQKADMENATANPANAQFYAFGPSGIENTTAASGAPVYVSFPHFLHGDSSLVAAVEGLTPDAALHESNLDMEPQTGLLTQAHKRLQVNYQMQDKTFPTTKPDTLDLAHSICANLTTLITILDSSDMNITVPLPDCNRTVFNELFTCFGTPVQWTFYNGEIFFPYGWVDEHFKLPDSDADDIHDSLLFIDTLAEDVQFWSLIAAGIFFAIIVAMLYRGHIDMRARGQTVWHAFDETSPATPYKRRNSRGEEVRSDLTNPIAQERAGEGYLANAGSSPFLA